MCRVCIGRDLRVSDRCAEYALVVTCGCRTNGGGDNLEVVKRCELLVEKQYFRRREYWFI
jgi:hypothetical protein